MIHALLIRPGVTLAVGNVSCDRATSRGLPRRYAFYGKHRCHPSTIENISSETALLVKDCPAY